MPSGRDGFVGASERVDGCYGKIPEVSGACVEKVRVDQEAAEARLADLFVPGFDGGAWEDTWVTTDGSAHIMCSATRML